MKQSSPTGILAAHARQPSLENEVNLRSFNLEEIEDFDNDDKNDNKTNNSNETGLHDFVHQLDRLWTLAKPKVLQEEKITTTTTNNETIMSNQDAQNESLQQAEQKQAAEDHENDYGDYDDDDDDDYLEVFGGEESDGLMKSSSRGLYFYSVRILGMLLLIGLVTLITVKSVHQPYTTDESVEGEAGGSEGTGALDSEGAAAAAGTLACFDDPLELHRAVDYYLLAHQVDYHNLSYAALSDQSVVVKYGKSISNFCFTDQLTDMSFLFAVERNPLVEWFDFPDDLSQWDVSHVERMDGMFSNAKAFNQPIGTSWNTRSVRNMNSLFHGAASFNQDLSAWDTSNVEDMGSMFEEATVFNQPVNTWSMSNVRTTRSMFYKTGAFNQQMDQWDTSNIIDMTLMFAHAQAFNHPSINEWDVSNVHHMTQMFTYAPLFNQPLEKWQPRSVEIMTRMFANAESFDQDLCSWGTFLSNHQDEKISAMFVDTKCPAAQETTLLSTVPVGPLCHVCTG